MRGDSLKERILRVATIEDVVAAYVPLQRSGAGYVGLCPFHADKHPSLHVHPGQQFFKCFACGEGGDLFAFVQGRRQGRTARGRPERGQPVPRTKRQMKTVTTNCLLSILNCPFGRLAPPIVCSPPCCSLTCRKTRL